MFHIPSTVQVCIICLDTESKLYVMGKYKLGKAYENLTGQPISDEEHITKFLCAECMHRLLNFSKFRYKSLRARAVLEDLLRNYSAITLDHVKSVDRNIYQLKSDIVKTVLEPDHCDLYIECPDTDIQTEPDSVTVKREERHDSVSIEEHNPQQHIADATEHNDVANRQTNLDTLFENTIVKTEQNAYDDHIDIKSEIINEYDDSNDICNDYIEVANDDYLSVSTLVLDSKPTIEELLDQRQKSCVENTQNRDMSSETTNAKKCINGHITDKNNHRTDGLNLDSISNEINKKLQDKLEFETATKNFTLFDEFINTNKVLEPGYSKKVQNYRSRIKIEASDFWESNSDEDTELLVERKIKQDSVKSKEVPSKPYSCTICNYKCKLKINLTVHMRGHKGKKYFQCNLCDYKCTKRNNLNIHMMKHTDVKAYGCEMCGSKYKNRNNLVRHMKTHYTEQTFVCNICDHKTHLKRYLVKHMMTHNSMEPYSCQLCDCNYSSQSGLKRHMWSHTDEKRGKSGGKNLKTPKSILETHLRNESKKTYTCELCDGKFATKGHFERHIKTHTGEKPFGCDLCEQKFSQRVTLKKHMFIHTGEKPYSCDTCPYKCTSNIDMVKHKRTHTGEKPYACTYCDFRCNTSYSLVTHTRGHTGEKPFSCELCEYKGTRTSQLVRHMRTHTGEKRFSCDICDYKCTRRCNLQSHMRIHTGQMFSCDMCKYKTANKSCLVVHIKRHMQLIAQGKGKVKRERL